MRQHAAALEMVTRRKPQALGTGGIADEFTNGIHQVRPRSGAVLLMSACATQPQVADTIYAGGDIVTVNDQQPTAEAVAVKDGKILAVGARAAIERAHKGATRRSSTWRERPCCPASSMPTATTSAR